MAMKGVVFSIDMLVAVTVFMLAVNVLLLVQRSGELQSSRYEQLGVYARDAQVILEKTKVVDVQNTRVWDYVNNGTIKSYDVNKTILEVVGSFWAEGNTSIASDILKAVLLESGFIDTNKTYFKIELENTTLLENNVTYTTAISSRSVVTGYLLGKPTSGYISRAWLGNIQGNTTLFIDFSPLGSGFSTAITTQAGNLTYEKAFQLPSDAENITATLYLSMHEEGGNVTVWLNGVQKFKDYVSDTSSCSISCNSSSSKCAVYYNSTVLTGLQPGWNVLRIVQDRPSLYHAHTHPGLLLRVDYQNVRDPNYIIDANTYVKENLTYVEGHPSAWAVYPIHIPEDATVNSARVYVKGQGVNSLGEIWVNDYVVWRNTTGAGGLNQLNGAGVTLDVKNRLRLTGANKSTGETNMLEIYFDIPPNGTGVDAPSSGATNDSIIWNSSYVELNYTRASSIVKYGFAPVTTAFQFDNIDGLGDSLIKNVTWNISNAQIISAYFHPLQKCSFRIAVSAWHLGEVNPNWTLGASCGSYSCSSCNCRYDGNWNVSQVFKSRTSRAVPSTVNIPDSRLANNSQNYVKARDGFCGGSCSNFILMNSTMEYTILVPAQVGYGDVFANDTAAKSDAVARLQAQIAPYGINGTVNADAPSVAGISWLWGPSKLKITIGV